MKKNGMSHIEIVLSFLLFLSAIVAIFYFFNPVDANRANESIAQQTVNEISRNLSMVMNTYSVKVGQLNGGNTQIIAISVPSGWVSAEKKVVAYDHEGIRVNAGRKGDYTYIEAKPNQFVYLYFAEDFEENIENPPSTPFDSSKYVSGKIESREVVSSLKVVNMNRSYAENYLGLKRSVKMADKNEFSFDIFAGQEVLARGEKYMPENQNIYAAELQREIATENGEIFVGRISVRVW